MEATSWWVYISVYAAFQGGVSFQLGEIMPLSNTEVRKANPEETPTASLTFMQRASSEVIDIHFAEGADERAQASWTRSMTAMICKMPLSEEDYDDEKDNNEIQESR